MKPQRILVFAFAIAALTVSWQRSLLAIGPTVLMFHGGSLKQPIFLTGADTAVFPDLTRTSGITNSDIANRPYVDVAVFWGSLTDPAANGGSGLQGLRPEMAWQHARFYPAAGHQPALFVATQFTKNSQPVPTDKTAFPTGGILSDAALEILKRARIPGATAASQGLRTDLRGRQISLGDAGLRGSVVYLRSRIARARD